MSERDATLKAQLEPLIHQEARELDAFLDLLREEQETLTVGRPEQLAPIAQAKGAACARLSDFDRERRALLAQSGFSVRTEQTPTWLRREPQNSQLRHAWQTLLGLAAEAREMNRVNGALLKTRLAQNHRALSVLMSAPDQTTLYGPDGQARARAAGRAIDRA